MAQAYVGIAVLGVASLLGQTGAVGLLAGVRIPLDGMIDTVFAQQDKGATTKTPDPLRLPCRRTRPCRARRRGHAGSASRSRAADRPFRASDRDFVERHKLQADPVVKELIARTQWQALELVEMGSSLRRVLACFYERIVEHRELFDDLLPHTHRALLQGVAETREDVRAIRHQVDRLVAQMEAQAHQFGIKEGMLIGLARRYAEGSPGDFDAAYRGLERALEVAHERQERDSLPSNLSEAVQAVIDEVDVNNDGKIDEGAARIDEENSPPWTMRMNAVASSVFACTTGP
ncbi:MAG: hypothetical protein R3C97_00930 [Geminicoccaceae bacterium]